MSIPREHEGRGPSAADSDTPQPAGPVAEEGGALRAGASSTPPSSPPPAGGEPENPAGSASQTDRESDQVDRDLDALLADTQRERDEYLDLAKRTKADFENFRRRMTSEVQAAGARGKAEVLRDVLPVLDDLERALQAEGLDPDGDSPDGLAHGVLLVFRSLRDSLAKHGIEAVDPTGEKFDPTLHEALSTQPSEGVESGTVVETMQKGYRLGEQLIRPARVVVAE
jgi:molecular chaperone GrpE